MRCFGFIIKTVDEMIHATVLGLPQLQADVRDWIAMAPDNDESSGHLEAEEAKEPAAHGLDETFGKNAADFRFEGGEIALM